VDLVLPGENIHTAKIPTVKIPIANCKEERKVVTFADEHGKVLVLVRMRSVDDDYNFCQSLSLDTIVEELIQQQESPNGR